ncbi:hypothetical protein D3C87_1912060 [compost metagenome]
MAAEDAHRPVFCESMWKRNCIWLLLPTRKAGIRISLLTDALPPEISGTLTRLSSFCAVSGLSR